MQYTTLVVMLLAACSSSGSTTPTPPSVNGKWTGTTDNETLSMVLAENGGSVTGRGTLTNAPFGTQAETIRGSYAAPTISLSMTSGLQPAINLIATVAGKTLTGTLQVPCGSIEETQHHPASHSSSSSSPQSNSSSAAVSPPCYASDAMITLTTP